MPFRLLAVAAGVALLVSLSLASGQGLDAFAIARSHPAIAYFTRPVNDPVAQLIQKVERGEVTLTRDAHGYLSSVLDALGIAPQSQVLVFSKTSFQASKIGPQNPRALYFNDAASVGWIRGAEYLEFASQDPEQGTIFYTLRQSAAGTPEFERSNACLSCHISESTMNVPGMFAGSVYPTPEGQTMYAPVYYTDHRSRFEQRWGGWYVTGRHGGARHMGNGVVRTPTDLASIVSDDNQNLASLDKRFDTTGYLSPYSDIVALMVLEHQMHMSNLLTRAAWEARVNTPEARALATGAVPPVDNSVIGATRPVAGALGALKVRPLAEAVVEIVDYMLFVDEVPFEGPVSGASGFAARFSAQGPRDPQGRSLRQLDLTRRLLRYPCSYMIYSAQFEALPTVVRDAIYARLWQVLSGGARDPIYDKIAPDDRRAIVEILRATKPDLPPQFRQSV